MSLGKGAHFQGPQLGSDKALDGLIEGAPLGKLDSLQSPYSTNVEDFNVPMVDGDLITAGFNETAINTATGRTEVVDAETGYLLLHPGSSDDGGVNLRFADDVSAAQGFDAIDMLGAIDNTATMMENRELWFQYRVGFSTEEAAGAWQGKVMFGWLTDDVACLDTGDGVPALKAEGGTGFHIGEDGVLSFFSQTAALTSVATANIIPSVNVLTDLATVAAADSFVWYTLGWRTRFVDASAGTGNTRFYANGRLVGTVTDGLPMDVATPYGTRFEYLNGPAGFEMDMAVDYIASGITRPGLTYPYDTTADESRY